MDCKQCAENLTAFLDAELSPAEAAEVHCHLQTCASCADELQSFRKAAEYIESQIEEIAPKPETWRLVQARISTGRAPRPQFRFFSLRWHLAATMLVVFGIFGFGYIQYRRFEKRSLNSFIAKYALERDVRIRTVLTRSGGDVEVEKTYRGNPFIEVNFTPVDNPFLLEDR
jgi:predicted anti-sigma-YlaC factor YlaD